MTGRAGAARAIGDALHLAATHHGGGIALEVVLQDVALSWRAEAGVDIEPGEQLRAIVDDLTALVDSGRSQR